MVTFLALQEIVRSPYLPALASRTHTSEKRFPLTFYTARDTPRMSSWNRFARNTGRVQSHTHMGHNLLEVR